jgi:hypothetical protein
MNNKIFGEDQQQEAKGRMARLFSHFANLCEKAKILYLKG